VAGDCGLVLTTGLTTQQITAGIRCPGSHYSYSFLLEEPPGSMLLSPLAKLGFISDICACIAEHADSPPSNNKDQATPPPEAPAITGSINAISNNNSHLSPNHVPSNRIPTTPYPPLRCTNYSMRSHISLQRSHRP
jgi:hypothetical protein